MANPERIPLYQIPTENDYAAAADMMDESYAARGSAWTVYHQRTVLDMHRIPGMREYFQALSSVASLIEPIEDDTLRPLDPRFRATHAFRAGMWSGGNMADIIHNETVPYEQTHRLLAASMPHVRYAGQEEYEENGSHLERIGREGLGLIGASAREYVERWGADIVSDKRVRRYYALGLGAVVLTAHAAYKAGYESVLAQQAASSFDIAAIEQYLAHKWDTSEK